MSKRVRKSQKTAVIERLFHARWDDERATVTDPLVTFDDVKRAIGGTGGENGKPATELGRGSIYNFFKDFVRNTESANAWWPESVLRLGYTARQVTGGGACLQFVPLQIDQKLAFPKFCVPNLSASRHRVESVSLPLASRRLGREDESWLNQVIVRLRLVETHFSIFAGMDVLQVDHLQMSVKLARAEVDALYLGLEKTAEGNREFIISCEAKGAKDDILEDQIIAQVQAVFSTRSVTQRVVVPIAVKIVATSAIYLVQFEAIPREQATTLSRLVKSREQVYELVPPVPGIG